MTETLNIGAGRTSTAEAKPARKSLLGRFAAQYADIKTPFEVILPDGSSQRFGQGTPTFQVAVRTQNGVKALSSLTRARSRRRTSRATSTSTATCSSPSSCAVR
ncbi:MAG: hypothetical protein WDN08_16845 [Rhizomicrobium sp.]